MREKKNRRVFSTSVMPTLPSTLNSVPPPSPILSSNRQLETTAIGIEFASDYFVYEVPTLDNNNESSLSR